MHLLATGRNPIASREREVQMIGLVVFSALVILGFVALIVMKIRWSRQAARKFVTSAAGNDSAR
jgi:hypothetical protein